MRDKFGKLIDRIEIANPIDGKEVAATGRELVQHGIGGLRVEDPGDDLEELIPIITKTAQIKALKDYSDATVVFNLTCLPPFKGYETRHEEQINRIRIKLSEVGFKAKRVFIILPAGDVEGIDG